MATTIPVAASRYNAIRDTVNKVLGVSNIGDPTYGYGESFSNNPVTGDFDTNGVSTDKVSAQQYEELYFDLIRARIHQVGTGGVTILPYPEGNFEGNPSADTIDESYTLGLETLAANIETDRFDIDVATQADVGALLDQFGGQVSSVYDNSARGSWNGTLLHIFDVNFPSATSRRHFFNAGGQIRIDANIVYGGSQTKTLTWQNAFNNMGTYSIAADRSFSSTGLGTTTSRGNYDLTGSYQTIYRLLPGGATYVNNFYEIRALSLNDLSIRVRVQFTDGPENVQTAFSIDENVLGDLYSNASLVVPNGSATINGTPTDTVVYSDSATGSIISPL